MFTDFHRKVRTEHLRRDAFLYVRQSTLRQVFENTESTQRQYALRDRAVALGWPIERVHTIDGDLGLSGAHAENRDGFQHLVSEVALGHAGIVLGLEVSRLARNNADWQRLLELCALSGTLISDEDGVYDPAYFNDRLLLGLKGTISAAELQVLKARLIGGQRNKARRGALELRLPIGLAYNATHVVMLDPDPRIQARVRFIFDVFRQTRSASATLERFRQEGLEFPRRIPRGIGKGRVIFGSLDLSRVLQVLHHPRYAGAFVYGRHRTTHRPDSTPTVIAVGREDWQVLIQDAHPGYISWQEFESNQQTLVKNIAGSALRDRRRWLPDSEALLQGHVLCGVCGTRMEVRYDPRNGRRVNYYRCQNTVIRRPGRGCRWIRAEEIDAAIGALLIQTVTSANLTSVLAVQDALTERLQREEALRRQELERLRHTAELKRRRFLNCDPDHRLVADALEADWNAALRRLDAAQQQQERHKQSDSLQLDEHRRSQLLSLAQDFPRAWADPCTSPHERKRMLGLLIEDVTLMQGDPIDVHVRFRGGQTTSLSVQRPRPPPRACKVQPEVIRELDELLQTCSDREAAARLNALGHRNWLGQPFTTRRLVQLRQSAGLKTRFQRLRAQGFLTAREMARQLDLCVTRTYELGREGVLPQQRYGRGHRCLFAPLDGAVFVRGCGGRYRSTPPRLFRKGKSSRVTP
jgi:DNA invertase Pin-like site-specific DNA recombinase